MRCFRYKADRIPVLIIVSLFFADLAMFFSVSNKLAVVLWSMVMVCAKAFISAWNHHHQHVHTFRQRVFNRLLEIVYTFHTGFTTNVWVLHHNLGHHPNYLDQTRDESAWQRRDGTRMGVVEYTFTIAATGYLRGFRNGLRHPKYHRDFVTMGFVNLLLLIGLFLLHPFNALVIFLIPMMLVYVATCYVTYDHHSGLETENHLEASRNVTNRFYNLISGNLGYHTAHHMKQGLHWSKLPEYHRSIAGKINPDLISDRFPVWGRWEGR